MAEDKIKWAMERMAEYFRDFRHTPVTYRVGNQSIANLSATIGKSILSRDAQFGAVAVLHTDRDFIISREDLVLNSVEVEPNNGHLIDVVEGGVTYRYEVTNFGLSERPWRWTDEFRTRRRIRTKFREIVS